MNRLCCCLMALVATATTLHAQYNPASNTLSTEAQAAWNRTYKNVLEGAAQMPEDKWSYRPTPEAMSFRDIIAHVADSAMGSCSGLNGARKNIGAAKMQTKAELIAALKTAQAECDTAYAPNDAKDLELVTGGMGAPRTRLTSLWGNTVHIEHEYAQMAVHIRINGIVPASTAGRMPAPPPAAPKPM